MAYNTRWIELEAPTKKQTFKMTHFKSLDGDNIIVELHDHCTCYDRVNASTMTSKEANEFFKDLVKIGWNVIRNEFA